MVLKVLSGLEQLETTLMGMDQYKQGTSLRIILAVRGKHKHLLALIRLWLVSI